MSLESPPKKLSQSFVCLDQGVPIAFHFKSSVPENNANPDVATSCALELEINQASLLPLTPAKKDHYEISNQEAPPKLKKFGRSRELARYFHQYECEDFMEYAVDTFDWKKSGPLVVPNFGTMSLIRDIWLKCPYFVPNR